MDKLLAIDLFCGIGGWADGFLAEGWKVVGFDIEIRPYPGQLVIQDVQTLHGRQFRGATVIVASPPCQGYSYRSMPWSRAKALPPPDNSLFEACFRIQREASEAAGHHVPMIVENVRGAQKYVGKAEWHYGSYYLWGDVPVLMPITKKYKSKGMNWNDRSKHGQDFTRIAGKQLSDGIKQGNSWFHDSKAGGRKFSSKSPRRAEYAALIAKIPFPLAHHIAKVFKNKL